MFAEDACSSPCPRFLPGHVDENGMVQCLACQMFFLDEDPTVDTPDPAGVQ